MIRTLIADDDALLRAALRTMVDWEALGYTLVWDCTNGLQMLELLQRTTVDLLITDMKMPLLDGLGLIRRLRQSALLPVTVVLSGYDEYELVQEAFRREWLMMKKDEVTFDYSYAFGALGFVGLLRTWLERDCVEKADDMAVLSDRMIRLGLTSSLQTP